jgi:hypothetical protein
MNLHLFGASTPTGEALRLRSAACLPGWSVAVYSRKLHASFPACHWADFHDPSGFCPAGPSDYPGLWISFAPIWLLSPFLEQLAIHYPERLRGLRGVIACSSSSALTKRFAANRFDRQLVKRLVNAEQQLLATCSRLQVPCRILRPTLIYGQVGPYGDQNLSRLIALLRRLPLLPLPAETGLRQPIHASQLASVALLMAKQLVYKDSDPGQPDCIEVGGDTELSYADMLLALQRSLPQADFARHCRLLPVPNRLFFLVAAPLLIRFPKAFEAVLRIGADLSGFTPAHQLLSEPPQPFPMMPLAS